MKIDIHASRDLLVTHAKEVEEVLRRAVRDALLDHKRAGNPVASWVEGRVVLIEANKIPVDDSPRQEQVKR